MRIQFLAFAALLSLSACDDAGSEDTQQRADASPDVGRDQGIDRGVDAAPDGPLPDTLLDGSPLDVMPSGDAVVDVDGGADGADAGDSDGAPDAAVDAATDAPTDAPTDGGGDAGDMGVDGRVELDLGPDLGRDAEPDAMADAAPDVLPDMEPDVVPDQGTPADCVRWEAVPDDQLLAALHAEVQGQYLPIDPDADLGGNPNRYTTARHLMFTRVERLTPPGENEPGVEGIYTGRFEPTGPDEEPDHGDINTEHIWPRARMDNDRDSVLFSHEESDIHNLYPSVSGANSTRGSLRFGEPVADRNLDYLPSVGGIDVHGDRVWSPRPERRGDVARAVFYFSVRWGRGIADTEEEVLRRWVTDDPADAREHTRNAAIAELQGNFNPFVECPDVLPRIADFIDFPTLDRELPDP